MQAADTLYLRADVGISDLPADCKPGIRAARLLYSDIGRALSKRGLDSVTGRSVVSVPRKLVLLATAMAPSLPVRSERAEAPIEAARFLVEAVLREPFFGAARSDPGAAFVVEYSRPGPCDSSNSSKPSSGETACERRNSNCSCSSPSHLLYSSGAPP